MDWLLEQTDLPYEAEEQAGLSLIISLAGWPWGARLILVHDKTLNYMLTRKL